MRGLLEPLWWPAVGHDDRTKLTKALVYALKSGSFNDFVTILDELRRSASKSDSGGNGRVMNTTHPPPPLD